MTDIEKKIGLVINIVKADRLVGAKLEGIKGM